jgi:signal transduction histidine kinase
MGGGGLCVPDTCASLVLSYLFFRGVLLPLRKMAADAGGLADANSINGRDHGHDELRIVGNYLTLLMSDVTKTRDHLLRSQQQLMHAEKLASVGKLAACVAHEIRNPLTAIRMWQYSIRKAVGDNPELVHKFDVVDEELTRLERIVENFLTFSRPPPMTLRPHSILSIIDKTLELFGHRCGEQQIEIVRDDSKNLPLVVVDVDQVKQVLLNLLRNSADAMPDGGTIWISTSLVQEHGCQEVLLRLRDDGCGMAQDVAERLFEPFFTTKESGNGLGLCIAASVMERLGGRIILESSNPNGTTLAIWLPASDEQNPDC